MPRLLSRIALPFQQESPSNNNDSNKENHNKPPLFQNVCPCNNNKESPPHKSSPKEKPIICDLKDATMNDVVLTDKKDNVVAGN